MKKLVQTIQKSFSDEEFDFTTLPIRSSIVILAIPMIIEMLMESVFAVVDIFFVGKLGKEALATVGLTESVLMVVYSIGMGVSMAATALVARRFGEKKFIEAGTSAFQLIITGGSIALLISVASFFFAENLLSLMGASDNVVQYGKHYTQIIFASNIVIVLLFLINGIFRGAGNAQLAMRTLILANGINIILDPILIFGIGSWEGFGLKGAAIATTIGRGIGVCFQLYQIFNGKHLIKIARENMLLKWEEIKKILSISSGGMGQFLIDSVSWILLSRLIATFGDTAVAGYTVAFRVIVFTILPAWGLSGAVSTLVGQNLGAKQIERAEASVKTTSVLTMSFLGLVSIIFFLFGEDISGFFTNEPDTIIIASKALKIITLGYLFFGLGMVLIQAFNGAGDTKSPMVINVTVLLGLELPLAYFLSKTVNWGVDGIFISIALCHSLHAVVCWFWFKRGTWKKVKV